MTDGTIGLDRYSRYPVFAARGRWPWQHCPDLRQRRRRRIHLLQCAL